MRLAVLAVSLFTSLSAAASVTPFNLAQKAYRGHYKDFKTSSDRKIGSYHTFCFSYKMNKTELINTVIDLAIDEGSLSVNDVDDRFESSLKAQIRNLCR